MAKTAGIIIVGNEILSGKITDTNAVYLCRELRSLGVALRKVSVIPDEVDLISREVGEFTESYDLVFTSGGVGPTHDDVTVEGVARALGVGVIRHPHLVSLLERHSRGNEARFKMAEVPEGAELLAADSLRFPVVVARNVYILPGVPEIFREKFEAVKERFREQPYFLANVFVRIGEATLARFLNDLLSAYPLLLLGSYPEFFNTEYKVKVTLESKDRTYLDKALVDLVDRLPKEAVVKVE
ncbi:MAG: competence/damage-inducible protein A [Candidatus Methylomirabilia bacterium]